MYFAPGEDSSKAKQGAATFVFVDLNLCKNCEIIWHFL